MRYLFYRFYRGAVFIRNEGDPDLRAWYVLSGFMSVNLYSIQKLLMLWIFQNKVGLPLSIQVILVLLLFIVNYFLFLFRNNTDKIIKKYSTESDQARKIGVIIAYLYVIITIILILCAKNNAI